jgi:uncharacterized tellurite resistance protein B-like protein
MFLADLRTQAEKEAFIGLAYSVAKADGCLGYSELALINLYSEELGIKKLGSQLQPAPLINLCRVFSDRRAKEIVYANLLPLAIIDNNHNEAQQAIMEVIQNELTISKAEAQKCEDELKLLTGSHFPNYVD